MLLCSSIAWRANCPILLHYHTPLYASTQYTEWHVQIQVHLNTELSCDTAMRYRIIYTIVQYSEICPPANEYNTCLPVCASVPGEINTVGLLRLRTRGHLSDLSSNTFRCSSVNSVCDSPLHDNEGKHGKQRRQV